MEKLCDLEKLGSVINSIKCNNKTLLFQQYLLYRLGSNWQKIAGDLAKHCCPLKVEGNRLVIGADNAPLANQLFMVKLQFLEKINQFLQGKYVFSDLKFICEARLRTYLAGETLQAEEGETIVWGKCPQCGSAMNNRQKICFACWLQEQRELENSFRHKLKNAPWLQKQDLELDENTGLLFERVRQDLAAMYYERVRNGTALEMDKLQAVLFYTSKRPEEISWEMMNQALAVLSGVRD